MFAAGALGVAMFDPATQRVWIHGTFWSNSDGFLAEWNPVSDTATRRSNAPSGVKEASAPALDTRRHDLAFLGVGELRVFDLDKGGMLVPQPRALQGDTAIAQIAATPTFENAWLNPRRPPPSCARPSFAFRA